MQSHKLSVRGEKESESKIHHGHFIVKNNKGLHTRPSTELVKCTSTFEANINLILDDTVVNAKSILGILMLAACQGTKILIEAQGPDAKAAIDAIQKLAEQKFNIQY